MHRGNRWVMVAFCAAALAAASGCKTLRGIGLESRSARVARQMKIEKDELAAQNAQLASQLAARAAEQKRADEKAKKLQEELTRLKTQKKTQVAKAGTPKAALTQDQRMERLMTTLQQTGLQIVTVNNKRGVRLQGDILFNSGKVDVKTGAKADLTRIADTVKAIGDDVVVYVDGHTDSDPLRFTKKLYKNNYGLGAARANSVARELARMGVPRTRLITRSFGQDCPIADNKDATGKKKNRRVEITFGFMDIPPGG